MLKKSCIAKSFFLLICVILIVCVNCDGCAEHLPIPTTTTTTTTTAAITIPSSSSVSSSSSSSLSSTNNHHINHSSITAMKAMSSTSGEVNDDAHTTKKTLSYYKAPYPAAAQHERRYVIYLQPQENEYDYKLQLLPGRVENVDGANHHFIGGEITQHTIEGWGYTYYKVKLGPTAGTRMMPIGEAATLRPRFIAMRSNSETQFIRYNSKLPVVVYVPDNAEVHYRIWKAQGDNNDGITAQQ